MLRSTNELLGYRILASDGKIGKVDDFYLDDQSWMLRYLVVDTDSILPGPKVLLIPSLLVEPKWEEKAIPVLISKEKVRKSPDVDTRKPVSRQHEEKILGEFGIDPYWVAHAHHWGGQIGTPLEELKKKTETSAEEARDEKDYHLRSLKEIKSYGFHAVDGDIGHVDDFIIDEQNWRLRYMVVDTRNWLPGRKVLISVSWIDRVNWGESKVNTVLERDQIKNSPEFDPSAPVNREYEERLYDFYGRPKDWP